MPVFLKFLKKQTNSTVESRESNYTVLFRTTARTPEGEFAKHERKARVSLLTKYLASAFGFISGSPDMIDAEFRPTRIARARAALRNWMYPKPSTFKTRHSGSKDDEGRFRSTRTLARARASVYHSFARARFPRAGFFVFARARDPRASSRAGRGTRISPGMSPH